VKNVWTLQIYDFNNSNIYLGVLSDVPRLVRSIIPLSSENLHEHPCKSFGKHSLGPSESTRETRAKSINKQRHHSILDKEQ
jgi:hypothetical protein